MSQFFDSVPEDLTEQTDANVDAEILKLQEMIKHANTLIAQNDIKIKNINEEAEPLQEEERRLREEVAKFVKQQRENKAELAAEKKRREENERLKAEAQRKLQTFMSEKSIRDELERFNSEIDDLTAGAFWRDKAYTHQIEGAKRLASAKRAVCGDKRGLGKTLTSLIFNDMVKSKKVLIITPKDVASNFVRETQFWLPDRIILNMVGKSKTMRDFFFNTAKHADECMVVLNYEAWFRDNSLIDRVIDMQFDTIIIDEAHNIKNIEGLAYEGIKEIVYGINKCPSCGAGRDELKFIKSPQGVINGVECQTCYLDHDFRKVPVGTDNHEMFCSIQNVLPMTGTAIVNSPDDIFPMLHLISRTEFPSKAQFIRDYAVASGFGRSRFAFGGQERLIRRLGSRYVGRTPDTAGVKFPKQDVIFHDIEFDYQKYPNQYRVMKEMYEWGALRFDNETVMSMSYMIALITRRRQAAVYPEGIQLKDENGVVLKTLNAGGESIKLDKAMELINQIVNEEEDCVVVFSKFKEALKEMERRLNSARISCIRYDGDTGYADRQAAQLDFDIKTMPKKEDGTLDFEKKRWKVLLGNYDSAGTGLNLTAARQMIILDRDWSPAYEDQATGRIQRLDSKQESIVHVLELEDLDFEQLGIDGFMKATMAIKAEHIGGFEDEAKKQELDNLYRRFFGHG